MPPKSSKGADTGAPPQRMTRYCNIARYIDDEDHPLFTVVNNLCMFGALGHRKHSGVTFLFPRQTSGRLRSDIIAKTFSDDAKGAVRLLNSCIISPYLPTIDEFKTASTIKDDNNKPITVVKSDGPRLTLSSGYVIEKDNNFKLLHEGAKFAVYNIVGIDNATTGSTEIDMSSSYSGGAPAYMRSVPSDQAVMKTVNALCDEDRCKHIADSLVAFLKDKPGWDDVPLYDHPLTLAYAVRHIIPVEHIQQWIGHTDVDVNGAYADAVDRYKSRMESKVDSRDSEQKTLLSSGNYRELATNVIKAYNGDMKKLCHDEVAFLCARSIANPDGKSKIMDIIKQHYLVPDKPTTTHCDPQLIKLTPNPTEVICMVIGFVRSPYFKWVGGTTATAKLSPDDRPDRIQPYSDIDEVKHAVASMSVSKV